MNSNNIKKQELSPILKSIVQLFQIILITKKINLCLLQLI